MLVVGGFNKWKFSLLLQEFSTVFFCFECRFFLLFISTLFSVARVAFNVVQSKTVHHAICRNLCFAFALHHNLRLEAHWVHFNSLPVEADEVNEEDHAEEDGDKWKE